MKKRLLLLAIPIALALAACSGGAGAVDPATGDGAETVAPAPRAATSQPATVTRLGGSEPGSAAPSTTRPQPTRESSTSSPAPVATSGPRPVVSAPSPRPTAIRQPTATRVPFDPYATPTPLWDPTPRVFPTSTSTAVPLPTRFVPSTVVAAAPQDQYQPLLNFQYTVPSGWSEVSTESSLVLYDSSGKIAVTITEFVVEPWKYPTALALGAQLFPSQPDDWDEWTMLTRGDIRGANAYEFQFTGMKQGVEYLNFIQWYLWGDIHVQVSLDVPIFDWSASGNVRSDVSRILGSFVPHDESRHFTDTEALELLRLRLDDRASGIYGRDEVILARYELTCEQIFTDLLGPPLYFGDGLWQMSAQTLTGVETWRVFEPAGSIVALDTNQSRC